MAYMRARMRELPQSDLFEKDTYFEASTEEVFTYTMMHYKVLMNVVKNGGNVILCISW